MDTGAWRATVHGVAKSQTRLSMHTKKKLARKEEMFFSPELKTKLYIYIYLNISFVWVLSHSVVSDSL